MRRINPLAATALAGIAFLLNPLWAQQTPPQKDPAPSDGQQPRVQVFTGTLVDADCKAGSPNDKCEVSDLSKTFGLQTTAGRFVKLDNDGNDKVLKAIQAAKTKTGAIPVSMRGEMDGEVLKVESVEIK